jgi:hypothetical protein
MDHDSYNEKMLSLVIQAIKGHWMTEDVWHWFALSWNADRVGFGAAAFEKWIHNHFNSSVTKYASEASSGDCVLMFACHNQETELLTKEGWIK